MTTGRLVSQPIIGDITGMHLAINVGLSNAAGDELRDLGAEIQDENLVVMHGYSAR